MSQHNLVFYHYWRSSCSWRVRWALLHKGISFDKVHVHLLKNEQKQAAYLQVNPQGYVPALSVNGKVLSESLAILEWLEETYPASPLLPKDPWERAKTRELALLIACGIQPLQNLKCTHRHSDKAEEREAWTRYFIEEGLRVFESKIKDNPGPYCLGSDISLAELFLVPQVYNALRNKIDMRAYPRCQAIYELCLKDPSCYAASPGQQPEADAP